MGTLTIHRLSQPRYQCLSPLAPGGSKMRDPGNEVETLRGLTCYWP